MAKKTKINAQQLPKDAETLSCFVASPGCSLVEVDFDSIEPKVQTIFSRDPAMWELYGGTAKHDIYLFNGRVLEPDPARRRRLNEIYGRLPLSEVKEEFKVERNKIYKGCTLSQTYGAGPRKWKQIIEKEGYNLPLSTVEGMHRNLQNLYAGLHAWDKQLRREWEYNGGWITTGLGRPRAVDRLIVKDLRNAFTQSTAHDVLLWYLVILEDLLAERKLSARPWIDDFHDQTIWECPAEQAEDVRQAFVDSFTYLNEQLNWALPVTGTPAVGQTLWEFKGG